MDEKDLIKLWGEKRKQIISSQVGPTLFLGIIAFAASDFNLSTLSTHSKLFIAVSTAVVGILAILNQIWITVEGAAIAEQLASIGAKSGIGKVISKSAAAFRLSGVLVNLFGLIAWVFLLNLLYK